MLLITLLSISEMFGQSVIRYYLASKGSNNPDGSIMNPFSNFDQVQQKIRNRTDRKTNVQVILRGGTYYLKKPIVFTPKDGGDSLHSIEYIAYKDEKVILNGGTVLSGKWVKSDKNSIWKLKLSAYDKRYGVFRALFVNGKRLPRAASDTMFSKGPIGKFASSYKVLDFPAIRRLVKDSIDVFCGFIYADNVLDSIRDLSGEVIVYNSWEASWHTIRNIDKKNHIINFENPATYPVGFYGPKIRFRIENSEDYLDSPGEWLLKSDISEVWYFARRGEDPNQLKFIAPIVDSLVIIKGDSNTGALVRNLKFSNINFQYSSSSWGVHRIAEVDKNKNSANFPWIRFDKGFSSNQAALDCGSSIYLEAATGCSFNYCSFSHLGNYAIWIGQFSSNNIVANCKIYDNGGGGIIIGFDITGGKRKSWPDGKSPAFNQVKGCVINDCGKVFPSGVGIGVMQANHTLLKSNIIHDLPYSGISVGWTYDRSENYTTDNLIDGNYIFNVMKVLADGAGIYTLGKQTGTRYTNNYIKNIYKSKHAIGSDNNGFFFDQSSSDFDVSGNTVVNIQNGEYRFNHSDSTQLKMRNNHFQKNSPNNNVLEQAIRKWNN
ncbi:Right handed beta helix region [Dyadobacter psychrophilus]|uniref:Right handed beta helix region n=2 Tax=Dyadobacter psychrophilus TaxID=651661 RepID=A0A1T5HCQ2_9BACT|nr:Right handed beta helix region [Dyadobacter psychrophilus]